MNCSDGSSPAIFPSGLTAGILGSHGGGCAESSSDSDGKLLQLDQHKTLSDWR